MKFWQKIENERKEIKFYKNNWRTVIKLIILKLIFLKNLLSFWNFTLKKVKFSSTFYHFLWKKQRVKTLFSFYAVLIFKMIYIFPLKEQLKKTQKRFFFAVKCFMTKIKKIFGPNLRTSYFIIFKIYWK